MSRLFSIAVLLCAVAAIAAATAADNPLPQAAAQGDVVRGTFEQQKHLAGLEQPLHSAGHFVVSRERGLLWQVQRPFETTLIINRRHLVQRVDGRQTLRLDRQEQPGLGVVAAVLIAVFQSDWARLREYFDLRVAQSGGDAWRVAMTPKTAAVGEFVRRLTVSGGAQIDRVAIDEAGGDRSVIELQVQPERAGALQPGEIEAFGE